MATGDGDTPDGKSRTRSRAKLHSVDSAHRREHLQLVPADTGYASAPRTIGMLIAQTALIAESAIGRDRRDLDRAPRERTRFGWFR